MNPEPRREGITELLRGQKRGIAVALSKAKEELHKLGRRAAKGGIQREVLEDRVRKALQREHLSEFVIATVKEERGQVTLNWHVDPVRRRLLERTRLGRRVLRTGHPVWSTGRIVCAFRGQWNVGQPATVMLAPILTSDQPAKRTTQIKPNFAKVGLELL